MTVFIATQFHYVLYQFLPKNNLLLGFSLVVSGFIAAVTFVTAGKLLKIELVEEIINKINSRFSKIK